MIISGIPLPRLVLGIGMTRRVVIWLCHCEPVLRQSQDELRGVRQSPRQFGDCFVANDAPHDDRSNFLGSGVRNPCEGTNKNHLIRDSSALWFSFLDSFKSTALRNGNYFAKRDNPIGMLRSGRRQPNRVEYFLPYYFSKLER